MKYWIDTEFIARPFTVDLVSIGVVAEDGREVYAESSEADWSKASPWTLENVRPQLGGKGMSLENISYALRNFTDHDEEPVFWGYFPAYDWVALVGLFGGLEELPFHYPQLCLDIKQWAIELGDPELPHQKGTRHQRPRRRPMDARGVGVSGGHCIRPAASGAASAIRIRVSSAAGARLDLRPRPAAFGPQSVP